MRAAGSLLPPHRPFDVTPPFVGLQHGEISQRVGVKMPTTPSMSPKRPRKTGMPSGTHVAIIGEARGGMAVMETFATDPLVQIVGVAEIQANAPGIALARRLGIPVTRDYRRLLDLERVDLIIDVSGNAKVWELLQDFHRMGVTVIGGANAKVHLGRISEPS